jgi:cytidyltransferase-like protein
MQFSKQDIPNLNIAGKVVGITSGCFDLLHFYHFRFLERCKAQCDFLIVGVDSDMLVYQNKNKVPMIPEHHRMAMVDALKCVDATFRMDSISDIDEFAVATSATKMFKNLPTIYGNEVKPPIGVNLILIPDIEEVSSTSALIEKIRSVSQTASLTYKPSKNE